TRYSGGQVERPTTRHRAVGGAVGNQLRGPSRSRSGTRGDPVIGAGGQVGVPLRAHAATIVNGRSGGMKSGSRLQVRTGIVGFESGRRLSMIRRMKAFGSGSECRASA